MLNQCLVSISKAVFIIIACLFTQGHYAQDDDNKPLKVMVVGDNMVVSTDDQDSFRKPLSVWLEVMGYQVDFVGSQKGVAGKTRDDFDSDHEGHDGLTGEKLMENIGAWTKAAGPDIILIYPPVKDLESYDRRFYQDQLKAVINNILDVNKDIIIILAEPMTFRGIDDYADRMKGFSIRNVARWYFKRAKVSTADLETGLELTKHTKSGRWANKPGEELMAQRWTIAFLAAIEPNWATIKAPEKLSHIQPMLQKMALGQVYTTVGKMLNDNTLHGDDATFARMLNDRIDVKANRYKNQIEDHIHNGRFKQADALANRAAVLFHGSPAGNRFQQIAGNVIEQAANQLLMKGVVAKEANQPEQARKFFNLTIERFPDTDSAEFAAAMLTLLPAPTTQPASEPASFLE